MRWTSPGRSRARRTVEVGVAALIIGAVTSLAAPTAASAAERWKAVRVAPAPSSPSVMIQLSTLGQAVSPAGLRSWMRSICPTGVVATGSR